MKKTRKNEKTINEIDGAARSASILFMAPVKLLQFLWDHRVYVRKHGKLCKIIREKSVNVKKECIKLGFVPPQILKKTIMI